MPPEVPDFELFVDGKKFTHFTRGWVKLSLDQAASQFELSYVDLDVDNADIGWPIEAGDPCSIRIADRLALTGYVDDLSVNYTADQIEWRCRGRSKLGDIVDSSAHHKKGRWSGANLETIATNLCKPFDISVEVDKVGNYAQPFKRFALDPGESVVEAITRAAKFRGLYPTSDAEGQLRLLSVGTRVLNDVRLEHGKNIIRGERFDSYSKRHSAYFMRGQSPSDDDGHGQTTAEESAAIFDAQIGRYRPLLLVATNAKGRSDLARRAIWERNRRAGEGERLIYRVGGYTHGEGPGRELWEPGVQIKVQDQRLLVDDVLLIESCVFRFAAEGDEAARAADLTLVRKEAYDL